MLIAAIFCPYSMVDLLEPQLKKNNNYKFLFICESKSEKQQGDSTLICFQKGMGYDFLFDNKVDLAIVYYWNYRLPEKIVQAIPFYNIHPSMLPQYRGPYPIQFQLLNSEKRLGVTVHRQCHLL